MFLSFSTLSTTENGSIKVKSLVRAKGLRCCTKYDLKSKVPNQKGRSLRQKAVKLRLL